MSGEPVYLPIHREFLAFATVEGLSPFSRDRGTLVTLLKPHRVRPGVVRSVGVSCMVPAIMGMPLVLNEAR